MWKKSGFVGRVVYTGPATTLSFTNTGPTATGTGNNRFYFTSLSSTAHWSEFFLVLRAKGLRHSGDQHDFSGINTVAEHPGETITISYGAGSEEVAVGEEGYDNTGDKDTYDGSNGYKYRYPYRYIWVDVTLIRPRITSHSWWNLNTGYYESEITVTALSLTSHLLRLSGIYWTASGNPPPFYSFGVTKTIADPFPFSELEGRTTPSQALKVGVVEYTSSATAANIHFAANAEGTSDPFSFHCEDSSFPYSLAFDSGENIVEVTPGQTFATEIEEIQSPIDSTTSNMHVLEGDLKVYLPDQVRPASGEYSSTIYCFVTPQ
ncbi:MAG: hypothetical protein GX911_06770 [Spirochaetales bacterium]|nr:hypothetical protein [Spirochaetales bacterium]